MSDAGSKKSKSTSQSRKGSKKSTTGSEKVLSESKSTPSFKYVPLEPGEVRPELQRVATWRDGLDDIFKEIKKTPDYHPVRIKPTNPPIELKKRPILKPPGALHHDYLFDDSSTIRDIGLCKIPQPYREWILEEKERWCGELWHVPCRESDENFRAFKTDTLQNTSTNVRWGMGENEDRLDQELDERVQEIEKLERFDALMKTDGNFKRQVWSEMMREGIIGYNRTSKKKESKYDLLTTGADGFRLLLRRRYGNVVRAWRTGLDLDGNGRVSFFEFCRAAREVGYEGSLRQLWNELNCNEDIAFITLDELDKSTYMRLNIFKDALIRTFGTIPKGWARFDMDCKRMVFWNDFLKGISTLVNFNLSLKEQKKLFADLDNDGGGFVTQDEFYFLDKWKSASDLEQMNEFRTKIKVKFVNCRTAWQFFKEFGKNEKLDSIGFTRAVDAAGIGPATLNLFRQIDSDESGQITFSEFVKLFNVEDKEMTVCPIHIFDPLPILAREISVNFGCDFTRELKIIAPSIKKSHEIYGKAIELIQQNDYAHFTALMDYESKIKPLSDDAMQPTQLDIETMMFEAQAAQNLLKKKICYDKWPVRTSTRNTVDWVHEAYDPGLKKIDRILGKANTKYKKFGERAIQRVRDIARIALQYDNCEGIRRGLKQLQKHFKVVKIENRFKNPTPLGWRDVNCTVELYIPELEVKHYAEIQLHHIRMAQARIFAHQHYRHIRNNLPKNVSLKDGENEETKIEEIQMFILEFLGSSQKFAFNNPGNVESDLERAKIWTVPWQNNDTVQKLGSEKFPEKLAPLPVVSTRSGFMHRDMKKQTCTPVVPDMRHNKAWVPVHHKPLKYFSKILNDIDENQDHQLQFARCKTTPNLQLERKKSTKRIVVQSENIARKIPTPRRHDHRPRAVAGCISSGKFGVPDGDLYVKQQVSQRFFTHSKKIIIS